VSGGALGLVVATVLALLGTVVVLGLPAITPSFLTEPPGSAMDGGILPAIVGTVGTTMLMTLAGVPIGVTTAIYLSEYASRRSLHATIVRAAVRNLAGVPSIIFGLFGLGFFVLFVGRGIDRALHAGSDPVFGRPAILWASLTLAVLTLPVVIVTTEEALRRVPRELREASAALGATKLQTIRRVLLPHAMPGILTGALLATARGAGEVAPILFTGVASYVAQAPTDLRAGFMHLGYHVYVLATQSPDVERTRPTLFGTVLVLLVLTAVLNAGALFLRSRMREETR
jgi:phosphate transport system permease protein